LFYMKTPTELRTHFSTDCHEDLRPAKLFSLGVIGSLLGEAGLPRKARGRARCNALCFFLTVLVWFAAISSSNAEPRHGVNGSIPMHPLQINQMADVGFNYARHWIFVDPNYTQVWNWPSYLNATLYALDFLDYNCVDYRARGIEVVLVLAEPPGGRNGSSFNLFKKNHWGRQAFKDLWEYIAKRYAWDSCVVGFDLMNEPNNPTKDVQQLLNETTALMRRYTYEKRIIHTPNRGNCNEMRDIKPVNDPFVWYTCHAYELHNFTHQQIEGRPAMRYSSKVRSALRESLQPVKKLAERIGPERILIGEGATNIYTNPADRYAWTKDLLDEVRPYNWLLYFAGENPGWPNVWMPDQPVLDLLRSEQK
jgi:hypothetical protein